MMNNINYWTKMYIILKTEQFEIYNNKYENNFTATVRIPS